MARGGGTSISGLTEESIISEVFAHYCGLAHHAVVECIERSLEKFYHCVCPPEMVRHDENR